MRRLEKGLYEKIFNSSTLGRARSIKHARKWNAANEPDSNLEFSAERYHFSPTRRLLNPLWNWIDRNLTYPWAKETVETHGFNWDDVFAHNEVDLRRSPFYENIVRESCHPYEWIQTKWRRERFFKIERVNNGFEMPDYIQQESRESSAAESFRKGYEWKQFVYNNYTSDMTPGVHSDRGGFLPFELLYTYGVLKQSHYDRYFFNEESYHFTDQVNIIDYWRKNPFYLDLDTEDGKRQFEDTINTAVEQFPGLLVPEGQSFDFESFYARRAILSNEDLSKFSPETVERLRAKLAEEDQQKQALNLVGDSDDYSGGTNTIGTESTVNHAEEGRRAFMN